MIVILCQWDLQESLLYIIHMIANGHNPAVRPGYARCMALEFLHSTFGIHYQCNDILSPFFNNNSIQSLLMPETLASLLPLYSPQQSS